MNIKSLLLLSSACLLITTGAFAQKKKAKEQKEPEGYKFETILENPVTSIKNQSSSGTCWVFSSLSFFESEILKAGYKQNLDLSEMFIVSHAYADKADKFVRLHGALNFGGGSSFGDALTVMKQYGMVPNCEMTGLNYGEEKHIHGELDALTDAYVNTIVKNPNRRLSKAWKKGFQGILDAYLGVIPEKFTFDGKEYTPKTYMNSLGINLDDYVDLTSFTHHPFYEKMIVEVPDNWRWEEAYNVPIDDMISIFDNALKNGYTIAWASDVSEKGFTRDGIGIIPDEEKIAKEAGSDQAKWIGKNAPDEKKVATPGPEKVITQEMRQEEFDNYKTTDDHGMHIYGIAKDQNGTKYYIVKNSWGEAGEYKGIWYVSEAFVRFKTTDFMVNKNAIPQEIRIKLGL
jgi:aminopeptidase C